MCDELTLIKKETSYKCISTQAMAVVADRMPRAQISLYLRSSETGRSVQDKHMEAILFCFPHTNSGSPIFHYFHPQTTFS